MRIRSCQLEDLPYIRRICLETADLPVKTRAQRAFLYNMYCDYYIEQEPEHCFVAVDEEDRPAGYVLCAPSYKRYRRMFLKKYLPRMFKNCPLYVFGAFGEILTQKPFAAEYPAHLHIDISEAYQRQGLGHKLMDALMAHLRAQDVPGVMLGVGASNEKGVSFYNRYGFTELRRVPGSKIMGFRP